MTAYGCFTILDFENLFGIGYLVEPELLSYLRTNLCCVTIDSLAPAYYNIDIANFLYGRCKCIGCCKCIGAGKFTVG